MIKSDFVESYVSDKSYFNISNLVRFMSGNSLMPSRRSWPIFKVCSHLLSLYLTKLIAGAQATNATNATNAIHSCFSTDDQYLANSQFSIYSWVSRGICVRSGNDEQLCWKSLIHSLEHLDEIRKGEDAGAASVLALLPTIGALLGAPTSEIWRLLTVVPFGGGLAMTLSFGGAILPVRAEEYENDLNRNKIAIERSVASRVKGSTQSEIAQKEIDGGLDQVMERILARMRQDESQQLAKGHLWVGLVGMIVFSAGAQAAMAVVEQGGVIGWWCVSRWWMHLWYFLVTFTALLENWAHYPFTKSWKLFVSDIPYGVNIRGGDSILPQLENPDGTAEVLDQLASLRAGTATLRGSKQYTRPRNAVLVMVSVAPQGQGRFRSGLRLLCKGLNIAAFVTGTAFFASVQLLALPVAVMALTLILAAGVFGRAITGWIVSGISKTEPLIHVVVNTPHEAQHVIARVLSLDNYDSQETGGNEVRKIQVELDGHVFISQRRVGHRSAWYLKTLGVLAPPFDLRTVHDPETSSDLFLASADQSECELGLMRK
ncbi:hypothetical protein MMC22_006215 [Lobaria immixta]|nr:hypothetical protein [Lobaria immixta]